MQSSSEIHVKIVIPFKQLKVPKQTSIFLSPQLWMCAMKKPRGSSEWHCCIWKPFFILHPACHIWNESFFFCAQLYWPKISEILLQCVWCWCVTHNCLICQVAKLNLPAEIIAKAPQVKALRGIHKKRKDFPLLVLWSFSQIAEWMDHLCGTKSLFWEADIS